MGDESLIHNRESRRIREGERTGDVGLSEVQPFTGDHCTGHGQPFTKLFELTVSNLLVRCAERDEREVSSQ